MDQEINKIARIMVLKCNGKRIIVKKYKEQRNMAQDIKEYRN